MAKAVKNQVQAQLVLGNDTDILEALRRNPSLIQFVENATPEMDMAAVSGNGRTIGLIPADRHTDELKTMAVTRHRNAIKLFENPSQELLLLALQREPKAKKVAVEV
jgi:hypothetical protein